MNMKSRQDWNDTDWANYLQIPVSEVKKCRALLDDMFVMAVERNKITQQYSFAMYRYDIAPSGVKRLQLAATDDKHSFADIKDAVVNANNIIACMELTPYWAKTLNMPAQAIQMLTIRTK